MKPLSLLIVAIRKEWLNLLEDSLKYAGYHFQIKQVESKQSAIKAFYESKYDLLISNCILPDGTITDLANVLGSQLPCLIMSERHCPVTADKVLAVNETTYYIHCSNKLGWIPALENTLAVWRSNAQQKINAQLQSNDHFHKKVLARCQDIIATEPEEESITLIFELLLDVLDQSRVSLCVPYILSDGSLEIVIEKEVIGPGVSLKHSFSQNPLEIPYFNRWKAMLEKGRVVVELASDLHSNEKQWLSRHDIQSMVAVPIRIQGEWVAYIALEDTMNGKEWSVAEIELLVSVADLIKKEFHPTKKSARLDPAFLTSPA
ncbi:GAF domain-containing protein [Dyadobacter arcticus]|uniref:GAF domain-containing protein n=1 Tax=Dyadobacter arcticus TaxID=1078754 RepID=A0ABX0USG8_9BACT|nr:GAF domain-containing protein [Dyadobacter arcticus]NIJ53931.1 GAF domain-containing protein [Dyadobacter arcticus]